MTLGCEAVTEILDALDAGERERVAALRAEGRFFWLDVSLGETSRDDLAAALDPPEHALRALRATGDPRQSRMLLADGASIGFALRCYARSEAPPNGAGSRLRPLWVRVVLTSDYLLTLHEERVSLPAVLAPELPAGRSRRYAVYSVLDAMLASAFDALEELELTLDALAATWTGDDGAPVPRSALQDTGASLATMRRRVTAEQAVFGRLGVEVRPRLRRRRGVVLRPARRAGAPPACVDRRGRQRHGHAARPPAQPARVSGERRGDDLRAAHVHHGVLRDELRLDGRPGRRPGRLRAARGFSSRSSRRRWPGGSSCAGSSAARHRAGGAAERVQASAAAGHRPPR